MNPDNKSNLISLSWRLVVAFLLFLAGTVIVYMIGPLGLPYSLLFFLVAGILISRPAGALLADLFMSPYWPKTYFNKPQPMYGIPQARRIKGLPEEAIMEYEKIAAKHPEEVRPWLEMIDVAIVDLKDGDRANAIFQEGITRLKKAEDKDRLAKFYADVRERLAPHVFHEPIQLHPRNSRPEAEAHPH